MQQQKWIPIMAAAGIGAAAYCSMTRNGRSWGQTLQQMVPLVSMMGGGMQNQQQAQGQMNQNQQGQSQQGMQSSSQQNGSMMVQ